MIMHDIEIVAIWFALVTSGMILTMLMPWFVSETHGSDVNHVERERIPAHQGLGERAGSMSLIEIEA